MWGYLLPMCFCVATTPLIMSQHSQVVTLFQMPQKCHEKYPCTKIFIPSFFQNFPKFKNFCHLKIFQIIHFFTFPPFEDIHMEKINTFWVNFNQNAYVFKIFYQKPLKKLRNFLQKNFTNKSTFLIWVNESLIFSKFLRRSAVYWFVCLLSLSFIKNSLFFAFLWLFENYFLRFFSKIFKYKSISLKILKRK